LTSDRRFSIFGFQMFLQRPRTACARTIGLALCVAVLAGHSLLTASAHTPDVAAWTASAFAGAPPPPARRGPALAVRRQDFGQLGINQSVMGTPLKIGRRQFEHGLGTHANSEIAVSFPAGAARTLKAMVGVDGNRGTLGSVEFLVEVGGKNVLHTRTLHGGDEAMPVNVEIPPSVDQIVLKVDMTADGPSSDHADWAAAQLVMSDGSAVWLDELAEQSAGDFWPAAQPPFSFVYHGASSETFLSSWKREVHSDDLADRVACQIQWQDAQTGLKVTALAAEFKDFPAVEWLLRFENCGAMDTPILEDIQALDVSLNTPPERNLTLDQINGDDASERSFVPSERKLASGQSVALAPVGGRSSNGTFPMFNLQEGARGFFTAIGWTGQWAASVQRGEAGATRLRAGMELTHLLLHPGESIRSPRILLLAWSGDRSDAHNQFRRLLLAHYLPKVDGQPAPFAVAAQSFNAGPANWGTEAGQLAAAKINRDLGCDTLWMDAGWFEGNFPNGTGNWIPKPKEFPHGLKPIGEACEKLGLKFLVWYEPERVCDNTHIALEHAAFVLPVNKPPAAGGLFNLGDPAARRWLTDLLIGQITDFHIHTYRNDFNMDPLSFWRQNDPPDRQGMTEIRYVQGLYAMWDELRARFPHMYLDDCASGGRRIDLEMIMRSVVQTRSDSAVAPGRSDWNQSQTYGLSLFLPVHATIGWEIGAYECRSAATLGFCAEWDILDKKFPLNYARSCIAEINENRRYWTGDYYPLTPWTMSPDLWLAWQLHRADLDEGMILAFRHQDCPYSSLQVSLRGLKPDQVYVVHFIDEEHRSVAKTMSGRQLAALELRIPARRQSLLVRYAPKKKL
jgi:alpha-galactosidase